MQHGGGLLNRWFTSPSLPRGRFRGHLHSTTFYLARQSSKVLRVKPSPEVCVWFCRCDRRISIYICVYILRLQTSTGEPPYFEPWSLSWPGGERPKHGVSKGVDRTGTGAITRVVACSVYSPSNVNVIYICIFAIFNPCSSWLQFFVRAAEEDAFRILASVEMSSSPFYGHFLVLSYLCHEQSSKQ